MYYLEFHPKALEDFKILDKKVRDRFSRKLNERLQNPHVLSDRLKGRVNRYKIKIRKPGFRLVYDVLDDGTANQRLFVLVIKKREDAYSEADDRS